MNDETLHNFPSYIEQVLADKQEPKVEKPVYKTIELRPFAKSRGLYEMVDGKLPERLPLPALPEATHEPIIVQPVCSKPNGILGYIKEIYRFISSQP